MSRKHYEMIAEALNITTNDVSPALELANRFQADNSRFDIERFMSAACGSSWNDAGRFVIRGGHFGPRYITTLVSVLEDTGAPTVDYTCLDIGYGIETGTVFLPAIGEADWT